MFVPLVLPFQITCVLFLVLLVTGLFVFKKSRGFVFLLLALWVLFAAVGVMTVVDEFRYGEFRYATAAEVNDNYVRMPDSAVDIHLFRQAGGHEVSFGVEQTELVSWMNEWSMYLM